LDPDARSPPCAPLGIGIWPMNVMLSNLRGQYY
jgi:hypothetical protein